MSTDEKSELQEKVSEFLGAMKKERTAAAGLVIILEKNQCPRSKLYHLIRTVGGGFVDPHLGKDKAIVFLAACLELLAEIAKEPKNKMPRLLAEAVRVATEEARWQRKPIKVIAEDETSQLVKH